MGLWLFRRKSRRKTIGAHAPIVSVAGPGYSSPARMAAVAASPASSLARRRSSTRKQPQQQHRPEPNKLRRRARAYSFESGRADSLAIARRTTKRPTAPASDALAALAAAAAARGRHDPGPGPGPGRPLGPVPTLHQAGKRDSEHLLSQSKRSKRRKNAHDREREAEIKALSSQPVRRDTADGGADGAAAARFGSRRGKDKEAWQPSSVSRPAAEPLDSAMSSDSDAVVAYTISPLAALAPKPTLRYASQPRIIRPPASYSASPQSRKLSVPITEASLKAHARVDDLADGMTASDLRQLMERDQRRRDRKRTSDEERAMQRLARQAERQQRLGAAAAYAGLGIDGTTSSGDRTADGERMGTEGDGGLPAAPQPAASAAAATAAQTAVKRKDLSPPAPARTNSKIRKLAKERKTPSRSSSRLDERGPVSRSDTDTSRKTGPRARLSWSTLGALFRWRTRSKRSAGPSSFSNLSASRDSVPRSQKLAGTNASSAAFQHATPVHARPTGAAWTAGAPSSSTSADSAAVPTSGPARSHPLKATTSSVPKRTLSRFREDLPDFLPTPPASRVPSPDAEPLPAQQVGSAPSEHSTRHEDHDMHDDADADADAESVIESNTAFPAARLQPSRESVSATNDTSDTAKPWPHLDGTEPSPEPQLSLSLASIDSEGSWLSGGRSSALRRHGAPAPQSLDHVSRSVRKQPYPAHRHRPDSSWTSSNDTGSTSDHPRPASAAAPAAPGDGNRMDVDMDVDVDEPSQPRGDVLLSSDEEMDTVNGDAEDARWDSVHQRKVETVEPAHAVSLARSREGLVKSFSDGEAGADDDSSIGGGSGGSSDSGGKRADSPTYPALAASPVSQASSDDKGEEDGGLQRATSVRLGRGHARQVSAGSAKLLGRSSADAVPPYHVTG